MIGWIQTFLSPPEHAAEIPPAERLRIATCILLTEAAQVDEEFAAAEKERIVEILRDRFSLSEEEVAELVTVSTVARAERNDLWHFTHQLNEICSVPEKQAIMEEVWRVVFADGALTGHEDHFARKIAHLLNLSHPKMIEAKQRARKPR